MVRDRAWWMRFVGGVAAGVALILASYLFLFFDSGLSLPYIGLIGEPDEGAIAVAVERQQAEEDLSQRAGQFNLLCLEMERHVRWCNQMIRRARMNDTLAGVLRKAGEMNVSIFPQSRFLISDDGRWILVDTGATDEDIIRYLNGGSLEQAQKAQK